MTTKYYFIIVIAQKAKWKLELSFSASQGKRRAEPLEEMHACHHG